jgi:hypothetical protein
MHASSLIKLYGTAGKPLSLLSVRDKLEARKNIFILQIRDPAILNASSDLAALQANWTSLNPAFVPTQQSLANFVKALKASGISVVKISPDWRTLALAGTTQAFASLPMAAISQTTQTTKPQSSTGDLKLQGWGTWAEGGTGAVLMVAAVGLATGGVGLAVCGIVGGVGLALFGDATIGPFGPVGPSTSGSSQPSGDAGTSQNDAPQGYQAGDETEVYGATSDADATAIADALNGLPATDPSSIPSDPSSAPICPGSISPVEFAEGGPLTPGSCPSSCPGSGPGSPGSGLGCPGSSFGA